MSGWVILQLLTIAAMPAAHHLARSRGRSPKAWLYVTLLIGPLALLVLLALGRGDRATARTIS